MMTSHASEAVRWTADEIIRELNQRVDVLHQLGARKIGLFGSYRRGDATPESDMDFVVVLARPSFDDYMAVKFYLEDLFGCAVDLVPEDSIKPRLRDTILSEALYVKGLS